MSASTVSRLIQEHLAAKLGVSPEAVVLTERFRRLGVDSLMATSMLAALGAHLGRSLSPTLAWQYPTPGELAKYLSGEVDEAAPEEPEVARTAADEPIAIVGIACRFPGAADPEAYWRLLRDGVDAVKDAPRDRWDVDGLFDPNLGVPGKMSTRWGGFLPDIASFDAAFFGISPREASQMDPQQRLMMELSWEALEDAGTAPASLKDTRTGVFFGAMWMDYTHLPGATPDRIAQHTATGQDLSIVPARVSYTLGLLGPSVAVNTACSSSLVALHIARQSLLRGESRVALAGGVNLLVSPDSTIAMSKFGAMAPDGKSKAFDARANGYVRGEGGGVIVMKRLSDAIADGDRVYCVVRGSAVNNDGFSNGLTAPSPKAQEAVLRDAVRDARIAPTEIQYVEAHGTGTMLGDPIEAGSLGAALGRGRDADRPLRIGSVKTNIGHLEAAAGMAGLLKVVLSMQHKELPATLHYQKPNPHIPFEQLRLKVQAKLEPWEAQNGKRVAGVSSFGFGGTNAHVILEAPDEARPPVVRLAAATAEGLKAKAAMLAEKLRVPSEAARARVRGLTEAPQGEHRLAASGDSAEAVAAQLEEFAKGIEAPGVVVGTVPAERRTVVGLFGGQGSQWIGMGRSLLQGDPAGRAALEAIDRAMRPFTGWSLVERLESDDASHLEDTAFVQPAIFAMQVAVSRAMQARGLVFDAVVGQSMGEVAAAHLAGALSLDDAARVICTRSALVGKARGGRMAVVPASLEATTEAIAPYGDRLSVAVAAGPESTVVAGEEEAVAALTAALAGRGLLVRAIRVDYASHSRFMDPLLPELRALLAPVKPRAGQLAFWSTVAGGPLPGETLDAEYWVKNLREPVLFAPTVLKMAAEHDAVFVEVDPHPVLATFVEQCMARAGRQAAVVPCSARDEPEVTMLAEAAGRLFVAGIAVEAEATRAPERSAELVLLTAKTPEALREAAARLKTHVQAHPHLRLDDLAYTLIAARSPMENAAVLAVPNRAALLEALGEAAEGNVAAARADETATAPKVVFVFPGQGSQWLGMGRELLVQEPAFRAALEDCDRAIAREAGWSVIAELNAPAESSRLNQVSVVQPVLFAVEVALAAVWRSWGVEPSAVVGHSMGEVAAACVAGALSIEDAAAVICRRSALLKRVSGQGEMALVELSVEGAKKEIAGLEHKLGIAVSNSRKSTVLSGDPAALAEVLAKLEARGVFCRRVKVDVASHSPQMDPLLDDLRAQLQTLSPRAAKVPLRSTVTGAVLTGAEMDAAYWCGNLREPVRFADAVEALWKEGATIFVEMSPHPILVPPVEEARQALGVPGLATGSLRREQPERRTLLEALGAMFVQGHPLDASKLFPASARRVPLPTYAWQRERHWLEAPEPQAVTARRGHGGHPLLGEPLRLATPEGAWVWDTTIGTGRLPWLADHGVQGAAVFPAAGYIEMLLAAGAHLLREGDAEVEVADVELLQMLSLQAAPEVAVQVVARSSGGDAWQVQIASRSSEAPDAPWTVHAQGTVRRRAQGRAGTVDVGAWKGGEAVDVPALYASFGKAGLEYGPAFQGIVELQRPAARGAAASAFGKVVLPEAAGSPSGLRMHPALLDSALQVVEAALLAGPLETWLPVRIASMHVTSAGRDVNGEAEARARGPLWCRATVAAPGADAAKRTADLVFADAAGHVIGEARGFVFQRVAAVVEHRAEDDWMMTLRWEPSALAASRGTAGRWLLVGDGAGVAGTLAAALEAGGHAVAREDGGATVEALRGRLASSFGGQPPTGVVHLGSLDAGDASLEAGLTRGADSVVRLVQALAGTGGRDVPRLFLVTRGAQAAGSGDVDVTQAPLLGLARVLATEHAELRCRRIDLDPHPSPDEASTLHAELIADDDEDEVAWRGAVRTAARLVRVPSVAGAQARRPEPVADRPYALAIGRRGSLEGLELRLADRRPPGKGEIEIEVQAAGINFRDVLRTMGLLPEDVSGPFAATALGMECAGTVVAVGEGVTELSIGQPVMGLVPRGAMASHVTTQAALVVPRPVRFSAAEAASALIAPLTAWYALDQVARLGKGERVLIHAAAGGVGLAAVQWARHVGAEVVATAGSPAKREKLEKMGVALVSDSRSNKFVADVRAWASDGVDVVLNSLAGDLIDQSFGLLREGGRFVELGMRDYLANRSLGLKPFLKGLSFSLVDLLSLIANRPERVGAMLRELGRLIDEGVFAPPEVEAFPISRAEDAFRKMAQGAHVGKLALTMADPDARVQVPVDKRTAIRRDGTYLVTGGLGGLGLSVAEWLARRGAGALLLAGRAGVTTDEQRRTIARMQGQGTKVTVAAVDVADRAALARALAAIGADQPLRGVVHAAGILEDGVIADLTPARLRKAMGPKAVGAWNLHVLTREAKLDLFVMYASVAGILGLPAQSNYAAANTFLDALAHHRRAHGLAATSVDWGIFGEVGLAAAKDNRGRRLEGRGLRSLTPAEGLSALERVLERGAAQVVVAPIDMKQWLEFMPAAAGSKMLAHLVDEGDAPATREAGTHGAAKNGAAHHELPKELTAMPAEKRQDALVDLVRADVARVLSLGRVGAVPAGKPLRELGLDSLMAVELRNALGRRFGVPLPSTLTFDHPTPTAIAAYLMTVLGAAAEKAPGKAAAKPAPQPRSVAPAPNRQQANDSRPAAPVPAKAPAAPADLALPAPRPDRIEAIPMGERWFADAFRVIPTPGGFAQRDADLTQVMKAIGLLNDAGVHATLTHVMIRAAALALARNPLLHQTVCGYRKLTPGSVDIGLSMAGKTSYAPVVVLAGADRVDLGGMVPKVNDGIAAAREKETVDLANLKKVGWTTPIGFLRRFSIRTMQGMFWYRRKLVGTFQVSCVPTADTSVPLQFYSGSILSFGRPREMVVAIGGKPAVRPTLTLTVCVDHVAMDELKAAALLDAIIRVVEGDELVEEARRTAARTVTTEIEPAVEARQALDPKALPAPPARNPGASAKP